MLAGFNKLQAKHSIIGDVRALGLIGGISIVKDKQTGEKFETPLAPRIVSEAAKNGLICRSVTFDQDTLVFAPPLIITKAEVGKLIEILDDTFAAIEKEVV